MIKSDGYEERVIVFIDILGFENHINETVKDPKHFNDIRKILNFTSELRKRNYDNEANGLGREVTVFSDSIVLSYLAGNKSSVLNLLLDVIHLQIEMFPEGVFMRGGLTVGELCHKDNIVFGPAMIEAYKLESKVAVYPRVVVSEKVFNTVRSNYFYSPKDEIDAVLDLLVRDFDGQYYVDFLTQSQEFDDNDLYLYALKKIKHYIEKEIEKNESKIYVKVKYQWFKNYYNSAINRFHDTELKNDLLIKE